MILQYPEELCTQMYLEDLIFILASQNLCGTCPEHLCCWGCWHAWCQTVVAGSFQKASARNGEQAPTSSPAVIFSSSHGLVEYTVQTLERDGDGGKTASPYNPPFIHWKAVPWTEVLTCAVKRTPIFLRYWLQIIYSVLRLHCRRVNFFKK